MSPSPPPHRRARRNSACPERPVLSPRRSQPRDLAPLAPLAPETYGDWGDTRWRDPACDRRPPSFAPAKVKIPLPTFPGHTDPHSPGAFLQAVVRYGRANGHTESQMLDNILPVAFIGPALTWYMALVLYSWEEFVIAFRGEFISRELVDSLERQLDHRVQLPTEPLTQFIGVITSFYTEYKPQTPDYEIVRRILHQAHPDYTPFLHNLQYATVTEVSATAHKIQSQVMVQRSYYRVFPPVRHTPDRFNSNPAFYPTPPPPLMSQHPRPFASVPS